MRLSFPAVLSIKFFSSPYLSTLFQVKNLQLLLLLLIYRSEPHFGNGRFGGLFCKAKVNEISQFCLNVLFPVMLGSHLLHPLHLHFFDDIDKHLQVPPNFEVWLHLFHKSICWVTVE